MKRILLASEAVLLVAAAVAVFILNSRGESIKIEPDSEQTLWGEWIVVAKPFAKCFEQPAGGAESGFVTIAEIYEVLGRKIRHSDGKSKIWYRFEKGWISADDVKTYSALAAAKTASAEMSGK